MQLSKRMMIQEDLDFLQIVSVVTSKFGATINNINIEKRCIEITCPGGKEQEIECAMAIGNVLEEKETNDVYLVD